MPAGRAPALRRRALAAVAAAAAVGVTGWLTLRLGPGWGLGALALCGAGLCLMAARRG